VFQQFGRRHGPVPVQHEIGQKPVFQRRNLHRHAPHGNAHAVGVEAEVTGLLQGRRVAAGAAD